MIKINLLPFRAARKRENVKRQITIYIVTVCVAVFAMAGVYFLKSNELSGLKDTESDRKKELAGYQKELKEIKELRNKIAQIKKKLEVIKNLEKGKTGPVYLLSDIADAVPKDKLWLKSLSEKGGKLSLSGTAMDNETVALFMKNLENTEQIVAPPDLKNVSDRPLTQFNLTVSDFALECKINSGAKN